MSNEIRTGIKLGGDASGWKAAAAEAEQSTARLNTGVEKLGISAKQNAFAMRQLPMQMTDIFVGLSSGQAPMTVLMQQGGQLKDTFGGIVPAARAVAGQVMGMINPLTLAGAAAAGLAFAAYRGSQEQSAYTRALILSGNAAGTTSGQMADMAARIDRVVGTQAKAAETLALMAGSGAIAGDSLERLAQVAISFEATTGRAVAETVDEFEQLAKAPLEAAVKLNEKYNYLTESVYRQVKALVEAGRGADAARLAQEALAASMETRSAQMEEQIGVIERAWRGVKKAVLETGDAMLSIGREPSLQERIKSLQDSLAARQERNSSLGIKDGKAAEELKQEISLLQEQERMLKRGAESRAEQARQVKAVVKWDEEGKKFLSDKAKLEQEIARAKTQGAEAGRTEEEINRRIAEIRASHKKGGDGGDSTYERLSQQMDRRLVLTRAEIDEEQKLTASEKFRLDMLQQISDAESKLGAAKAAKLRTMVAETAEQMRANEVAAEARRFVREQRDDDARRAVTAQAAAASLVEGNRNLRLEVEQIGLSREGMLALEQARISSAIAIKEEALARFQGLASYSREEDAIRAQIEALRERQQIVERKGRAQSADDQMKYWDQWRQQEKDQNRQRSEDLAGSIAQGILDGSRQGMNIMDIFRRELKAQFAKTVLQPMIAPVAKGVSGVVEGLLNMATNYLFGAGTGDPDGSYTALENSRLQARATGGAYGPGLVLRGESGPELSWENTGGYVFNANDTRQILGGAGGGSGGVTVVVNNNGAPLEVTGRRQTRGADGGLQVEVMVRQLEEQMADNVASGSGPMARAMESRYGLKTSMG